MIPFAEIVFGKKISTNILYYFRTLFRSSNHHIPGLKICVSMIHCCINSLSYRAGVNWTVFLQPAHTSLIVPAGRLVQRLTCENVLGCTSRQTKLGRTSRRTKLCTWSSLVQFYTLSVQFSTCLSWCITLPKIPILLCTPRNDPKKWKCHHTGAFLALW